jgi:hypothetical protein
MDQLTQKMTDPSLGPGSNGAMDDIAPCPRPVIDNHRLSNVFPEFLGNNPSRGIRTSSGGEPMYMVTGLGGTLRMP